MMVYVRDCIIKVKNGIARVHSESAVYCPDCGRKLFFHGTCKRKVRAQEKTRCYVLRVLFCKNCKKTHRELPDFIVGYKRYSRDELCEIVMNEERLYIAIKRLSRRQKEVVMLHFYKEMDLDEIAEDWGCDVARIIKILECALIRLRRYFKVEQHNSFLCVNGEK